MRIILPHSFIALQGPARSRCAYKSTAHRTLSSLCISPRVRTALENGQPVVCLESTIITHGMSYPDNFIMANAVERIIEDHGAVPATIAVLNGQARIGLEPGQLELLGKIGPKAGKLSRRDLSSAIADKATGGTTVSGTMILAKKAGIKVFVTGGIGGVHRNAESTMDISNDLEELARNDCAVVCAGPKAILDIPRTLEYLETKGVTVTTLGQDNLPAFYSRDSGIPSPQKCASAEEAARLILANLQLQLNSSTLVCVPIPEEASFDSKEMDLVIAKALNDAEEFGIRGKETTPFLLAAIARATAGRSLAANIALVKENARVGAQIACHMVKLINASAEDHTIDFEPVSRSKFSNDKDEAASDVESKADSRSRAQTSGTQVLVVGGVALDTVANISSTTLEDSALLKTSHSGTTSKSIGGVAGNMARASARSGVSTTLCTMLGSSSGVLDTGAVEIKARMAGDGVDMHILPQEGSNSATYTSIQANAELLVAVADMNINKSRSFSLTGLPQKSYPAIIIDANIPMAIQAILEADLQARIVCFEPTSVPKASSIFESLALRGPVKMWPENYITMITPNLYELQAIFTAAQEEGLLRTDSWWKIVNSLDITSVYRNKVERLLRSHPDLKCLQVNGVIQQAVNLLPLFGEIFLTLGKAGVLSFHLRLPKDVDEHGPRTITQIGQGTALEIIHHPPISENCTIVSDTGCGDTFTGILVASMVLGKSLRECVVHAQKGALSTLQSTESVSPSIERLVW